MGFLKSLFSSKESKTLPEPKNPSTVEDFLQIGVGRKRRGDFQGAKRAYYTAAKLDPKNAIIYYSLAKTCYVANERKEAISNYLISLHLVVNNMREALAQPTNNMIKAQRNILEGTLPLHILEDIREVHPDADLLLIDTEGVRHLAHAVVDLDSSISKSAKIAKHIKKYRESVLGKSNISIDHQLDETYYRPIGIGFAIDNLAWQGINYTNVAKFYYRQPHLSYGSIEPLLKKLSWVK
jgi:hypothetical protein